jgi:general stress protein 26
VTDSHGTTDPAQQQAEQQHVLDLARDARFCMVTVADDGGKLVSRPMTPQQVTDEGEIWFLVDTTSEQARQLTARPHVNLAFAERSSWLSVSGLAEIVHDRGKVHELWSAAAEAWFPDGPDAPNLGLLRVHGTSAEYWEAPGGPVATVLSFVKAKATGQPLDADHATVQLD